MDTKEAHALNVGDRVRWRDHTPEHQDAQYGTVAAKIGKGYGFQVLWDDNVLIEYRCVHAETLHLVA